MYKTKDLLDKGFDIKKLNKDLQEDIETIKVLSDNFKTSDSDAKELDALVSKQMDKIIDAEESVIKVKKDEADKAKEENIKDEAKKKGIQQGIQEGKAVAKASAKARKQKNREARKERLAMEAKEREKKKAKRTEKADKRKKKTKKKKLKDKKGVKRKKKKMIKVAVSKKRKMKKSKSIKKSKVKYKAKRTSPKKTRKVKKRKNMRKSTLKSRIKRFNKGRSASNIKRDKQRSALGLGKRISKKGKKVYYEYRSNRVDIHKPSKLEEGGTAYAVGGTTSDDLKLFISSVYVDVFEDSYEEGEGKRVNNYSMKELEGKMVNPKEIVSWLNKNLYISDKAGDYTIIDNRILTSQLQDAEGSEASQGEIERWKKGDGKLFSANYDIVVSLIENKKLTDVKLSELTGIGIYKKGGRIKSALMRDRKYVNNSESWESGRKKPHYKKRKFSMFKGGGKVGKTQKDYEEFLNEIGVPEHDHPENGGRLPFSMINSYGTWLRRNDPIAFRVGYSEWKNEYASGGGLFGGRTYKTGKAYKSDRARYSELPTHSIADGMGFGGHRLA